MPPVPPDSTHRNPNWDRPSHPSAGATRETASEISPRPGSDPWWTGCPPARCPGLAPDGTLRSLPQPRLDTCTTQSVLDYFDNTWTLTEVLFSGLRDLQGFYRPPYHGLRHPLIFYYVHPAALYINKLRVAGLRTEPLNAYFEQLFETGVDEMSWDDLSKNEMQWPTLVEAHAYRRECYAAVRGVIESHPGLRAGHAPIDPRHPLWALFMGFEHERIHLETSSVLVRELPVSLVERPKAWPADAPARGVRVEDPWRAIPGGSFRIGKPAAVPTYGWDNEYGTREVSVPPFRAAQTLVTNAEFLAFVEAGGYTQPDLWSEEGWRWRSGVNARWPAFWVPRGPSGVNQYDLRTIFEVVPFRDEWPALVNFHEAKAYAAWRSRADGAPIPYRLPTEGEHHALRAGAEPGPGLRWGSEQPAGGAAETDATGAVRGAFGNVWHWCEDHFHPLSGFHVHRFYDDFSTPCFDGEHQMILGGSFVSTGDEASVFARFHFRPHFFQHAGIRLIAPSAAGDTAVRLVPKAQREASYESEGMLGTYCLLHYANRSETAPYPFVPDDALDFPRRCADLVTEWMDRLGQPCRRAADIGCAVGGASFRLADRFEEVWGFDLSAKLVEAARTLKQTGELRYRRRDEGELSTDLVARIESPLARERAHFRQADACALPPELHDFDAVLAANLLCRIPSPRTFLARLGGARGLVRRGGILVIASPFSWMEKFTPREVWLGGVEENGRRRRSEDGLAEALPDFERLDRRELPLLIREHARKFEYIVPLVTVWRKR